MTKTPFAFNSRETYQSFVQKNKSEAEALIKKIREEKYAIKDIQRQKPGANVSYKTLLEMREQFQEGEKQRAEAKIEASRQYMDQTLLH